MLQLLRVRRLPRRLVLLRVQDRVYVLHGVLTVREQHRPVPVGRGPGESVSSRGVVGGPRADGGRYSYSYPYSRTPCRAEHYYYRG